MTDQPANPNDPEAERMAEQEGDPIDLGEPIAALADFEDDAPAGLVARIRRSIQRRTTTVQLLSFSWSVPVVVLKEFWILLVEQTNPKNPGKEGGREGKTY